MGRVEFKATCKNTIVGDGLGGVIVVPAITLLVPPMRNETGALYCDDLADPELLHCLVFIRANCNPQTSSESEGKCVRWISPGSHLNMSLETGE